MSSDEQRLLEAPVLEAVTGALALRRRRNRASAHDLAAAVRLALSPATTRRAAAIGRALRSVPGHERAARLLLRAAARRRSQRRPA